MRFYARCACFQRIAVVYAPAFSSLAEHVASFPMKLRFLFTSRYQPPLVSFFARFCARRWCVPIRTGWQSNASDGDVLLSEKTTNVVAWSGRVFPRRGGVRSIRFRLADCFASVPRSLPGDFPTWRGARDSRRRWFSLTDLFENFRDFFLNERGRWKTVCREFLNNMFVHLGSIFISLGGQINFCSLFFVYTWSSSSC